MQVYISLHKYITYDICKNHDIPDDVGREGINEAAGCCGCCCALYKEREHFFANTTFSDTKYVQ